MALEIHCSKGRATQLLMYSVISHIPMMALKMCFYRYFVNLLKSGKEVSIPARPYFLTTFPPWAISSVPIALLITYEQMTDQSIFTPCLSAECQPIRQPPNLLISPQLSNPTSQSPSSSPSLSTQFILVCSISQWPAPFSTHFLKPGTLSILFLSLSRHTACSISHQFQVVLTCKHL